MKEQGLSEQVWDGRGLSEGISSSMWEPACLLSSQSVTHQRMHCRNLVQNEYDAGGTSLDVESARTR
jgi:hypothetical protein